MTWNQKFGISVIDYLILVDKIFKIRSKIFLVICGIPRYSENCYQHLPETKKFGISIIDCNILDEIISKIKKKYFPGKLGYSENFNGDWPETKISESAS